ncbi:hypothetical protein [Nocardioides sp. TF02-7]|uniref:hypothetical protein n=1 Tax=Nocardioides sp. TF02-7 TaxID=2917724 RepID=UPI001F05A68A|nr:hypothetical protein [Nocardioides sp. TF02-7]UMG92857.1 hypothetical protein MF408_00210 [Nocardioides sp. TF02-7]
MSGRTAAVLDLTFEETHRFRPFALVAPGFEVPLEEPAEGAGGGGDADPPLSLSGTGPVAPFAAVTARVGRGRAAVGLAVPDGDHVLVRWSPRTRRVTLEVRRDGRTRVLRRRTVALRPGDGLAFALCERQVTALVDTGEGWRPLLTERAKVAARVDLRDEDELGRHRYACAGDVERPTAGLFGMTGLRDPHLVQHADGTPYERDGRVFLTWTCAGLGFFQQAHWSVWSMDPARPEQMRLESQLFFRRDGLLLGDHAGQLVRDGDRWLVAVSSWGDFAPGRIHVRHTETTADLLAGTHLLDTEPTPLPTDVGSWDPALLRRDGAWHVGFVESPSQDPFDFHPALARTTDANWWRGLEKVAAADALHQCEGPILATVDDETWLLASDGDARDYPILDLDGHRVGSLDAPYPTNIPHPQLVPDPAGGWLVVTFEGTQHAERVMGYGGHGDVVVMHSV